MGNLSIELNKIVKKVDLISMIALYIVELNDELWNYYDPQIDFFKQTYDIKFSVNGELSDESDNSPLIENFNHFTTT